MKCSECYWCTLNHPLSDEIICCNEKSKNYNQLFSKQEREIRGCNEGQTNKEVYCSILNFIKGEKQYE